MTIKKQEILKATEEAEEVKKNLVALYFDLNRLSMITEKEKNKKDVLKDSLKKLLNEHEVPLQVEGKRKKYNNLITIRNYLARYHRRLAQLLIRLSELGADDLPKGYTGIWDILFIQNLHIDLENVLVENNIRISYP